MKIHKVKLIDGGVKGMEVSYLAPMKGKSGITYEHEYSTRFAHPVPHELRDNIKRLKKHFIKIMDLKDKADIRITGVVTKSDGIQITVKQVIFNQYQTGWTSPFITAESEYVEYNQLSTDVELIYQQTVEYVTLAQDIKPSQYVLDLFDEKDKVLPKAIKAMDYTREDIMNMSENDQLLLMKEILEERGAIVMIDQEILEPAPFEA